MAADPGLPCTFGLRPELDWVVLPVLVDLMQITDLLKIGAIWQALVFLSQLGCKSLHDVENTQEFTRRRQASFELGNFEQSPQDAGAAYSELSNFVFQ